MESESTDVQIGRRNGLQKQRQEALAKVICQEFYQSDRVKQFHRALLQTEALKERDDQMTMKQRLICAAKEETRRLTSSARLKELERLEQEREKVRWKSVQKKAYKEFLTEQMEEQEERRMGKAEKAKEVEECKKLCEQYGREKKLLSEQKKEEMMQMRKAHTEHLQAMIDIQAAEAEKQEMQDERKRFFDTERDKRMMRKIENREERRRVVQRYKKMVVEQWAAEMQEKADEDEQLNAKILAEGIATWEAKLQQERAELEENRQSMRDAIAAHRESKRQALEDLAQEEDQIDRDILDAGKEQDLLWSESQQLSERREEEKRAVVDDFLRQQIADGLAQEEAAERQQAELSQQYAKLIAEEEEQYQRYTDGVIRAATEANRNTIPLLRAAKHGMWMGVGPIYGGMRANYLVPGASYEQMPNYVSTTTEDLQRLYATEYGQSTTRLSFIW